MKLLEKNNRGKGIAWVPLGGSQVEFIPGKKAWHGGWIWLHETLWPHGFLFLRLDVASNRISG